MDTYVVDFSCRYVKAESEEDAANKVYDEILAREVMPEICSVEKDTGPAHLDENGEAEDYVELEYIRKVRKSEKTGDATQLFGGDTGIDADFEHSESDDLQCCTCEYIFTRGELTPGMACPKCQSGNWVEGTIDA